MGEGDQIYRDESRVFLIPKEDVVEVSANCNNLKAYEICRDLVERPFGELAALD